MGYDAGASVIMVLHVLFVIFVLFGGLLALRWQRIVWLHLPAALWGFLVELTGWICPLTPLENRLRRLGGGAGYEGGFVEHYLAPLLYPAGLTRWSQLLFALAVLALNGTVYGYLLWRSHGHRKS